MTPASIAAEEAVPDAASEIRLYDLPESREAAVAQVRALKTLAGSRRISAYSMADLEERSAAGWGPLNDVLSALVAAGLSDVAEMPADQLSDLDGLDARVDRRRRIAAPHHRVAPGGRAQGGDRLQHACNASTRSAGRCTCRRCRATRRRDKPTTGYEDLRMVALARLMLAADAGSPVRIEVDWSLYGPKLAQVALTFGADHLDAVPATSNALGRRRETVEDVERNIRAAGFEPREIEWAGDW